MNSEAFYRQKALYRAIQKEEFPMVFYKCKTFQTYYLEERDSYRFHLQFERLARDIKYKEGLLEVSWIFSRLGEGEEVFLGIL